MKTIKTIIIFIYNALFTILAIPFVLITGIIHITYKMLYILILICLPIILGLNKKIFHNTFTIINSLIEYRDIDETSKKLELGKKETKEIEKILINSMKKKDNARSRRTERRKNIPKKTKK